MIADGQVYGGTIQGIGTALYEEMIYDERGQPLASTLADYLLPGSVEALNIRVIHMETPSPYTRFGQKRHWREWSDRPPAAIGNAVNDAISRYNTEIHELLTGYRGAY